MRKTCSEGAASKRHPREKETWGKDSHSTSHCWIFTLWLLMLYSFASIRSQVHHDFGVDWRWKLSRNVPGLQYQLGTAKIPSLMGQAATRLPASPLWSTLDYLDHTEYISLIISLLIHIHSIGSVPPESSNAILLKMTLPQWLPSCSYFPYGYQGAPF